MTSGREAFRATRAERPGDVSAGMELPTGGVIGETHSGRDKRAAWAAPRLRSDFRYIFLLFLMSSLRFSRSVCFSCSAKPLSIECM